MAVLTTRPGIGADTVIMIDGTDRTSWFQSFSPDDGLDGSEVRPLGETRSKMVHSGETTTASAEILALPEARRYFVTWKNTLNDQRALVYSPDGIARGNTQTTYDMLVMNVSNSVTQGDIQTITVNFHANDVREALHS